MGKERAGGLYRSVDAEPVEPGISYMADHLAGDKMDKLFRSKTIQTGNEGFDKRFNLSSDDEAAALRILSPSRMERILALADSSIGKFAVNLNSDGRLYIAVHSGRGFF